MDVLPPVASGAGRRGLVLVKLALMTVSAPHFLMQTAYRILGMPVMLKSNVVPESIRMAQLAFLAESAMVFVITFVTGITVRRSRSITLVRMAVLAPDDHMSTVDREPCFVVIKAVCGLPSCLAMTGLALFP